MALIKPGPLVADVRGSVGDVVFSRNASGAYVRNRTFPDQPESAERDKRQAALTALSQAWSGTLTPDQRETWTTYGRRHPMPNRLGDLRVLDGLRHFIRSNAQEWRVSEAITYHTAPPGPPAYPPTFEFKLYPAPDLLSFQVPSINYDPPPVGLRFYLYAGVQVSHGVNFYKGPWRYGKSIHFPAGTWNPPYLFMTLPYDLVVNKRVFARMVAVLNDGETSIAGYAYTDT